jgi:hypothetical protein
VQLADAQAGAAHEEQGAGEGILRGGPPERHAAERQAAGPSRSRRQFRTPRRLARFLLRSRGPTPCLTEPMFRRLSRKGVHPLTECTSDGAVKKRDRHARRPAFARCLRLWGERR